jgi:hypothetical protein
VVGLVVPTVWSVEEIVFVFIAFSPGYGFVIDVEIKLKNFISLL